jgi:UPF0755 protein
MASQRLKASLAGLSGAVVVFAFLLMDTPPSKGWEAASVVIPKGSSSSEVAQLLEDEGVLQHPIVFRALVLATMSAKHLKFGEYSFPNPPTSVEVWRKIYRGEVTRYTVTVAEGANLYDIARILDDLDLADPEEFLENASSEGIVRWLGIPGDTAEGFLFPDTYLLDKSMSCKDILEVMVRRFRRKFLPEWEDLARKDGFSLLDIVTIASIIEKETGIPEERPLVSAVIRNRLSLKMPLQMDPTVIYGLRRFGVDLTKKDLKTQSPYNSYRNRGLPPGPIANPGLPAIKAAVFPADTDYLYFVSRNDGSHKFSRTLSEHNLGVASFRRGEAVE